MFLYGAVSIASSFFSNRTVDLWNSQSEAGAVLGKNILGAMPPPN